MTGFRFVYSSCNPLLLSCLNKISQHPSVAKRRKMEMGPHFAVRPESKLTACHVLTRLSESHTFAKFVANPRFVQPTNCPKKNKTPSKRDRAPAIAINNSLVTKQHYRSYGGIPDSGKWGHLSNSSNDTSPRETCRNYYVICWHAASNLVDSSCIS